MSTLREELTSASAALTQAGCDTPRLDAELLLAHVLGVDRAALVLRANEQASGDVRTRYLALLTRRVKREPVAYILGRRAFRQLTLAVDPRVLIPRPETELLVEVGLELPQGVRVADIGTGSGAVALSLAQERPDLELVGADASAGALAVARMNAQRLGLSVSWVRSDLLAEVSAPFVLANLPYVADDEPLAPDIAMYEPRLALLGGPDGLDVIRRLVGQAGAASEVELVALEVGDRQARAAAELLAQAGFCDTEPRRDLAGVERVVVGRR